MKKETITLRINIADKIEFDEYCKSQDRSMSEMLLDYIKITLIEKRKKESS